MRYELLKHEEFDDFYQILLANFPLAEIKDYLFMKDSFENDDYNILSLKDENNKVMAVLSYYHHDDFRFIDYFAIAGNFKGQGIGSKMLQYFIDLDDKMVILEVEHPVDHQSKRRVAFYQRNGLVLNDRDFVVPVCLATKEPLHFYLMSTKAYLDDLRFEKNSKEILKLVYGIC